MRNMVKIMNNFGELLRKDSQISHEYEDEALVSSLRCTSMSYSLKEEQNSSEFKNKNQWLFNEDDEAGKIKVISFDRVPELCCCSGVHTCDAFFYDYKGKSKSYLIEFKNCQKNTLHNKFLDLKSDDCIIEKIADSGKLIKNELDFDGKYSASELVSNTHIIIVYNGKNDMPTGHISLGKTYTNNKNGNNPGKNKDKECNAKRPANLKFTRNDIDFADNIGRKIKELGFSGCIKDDFPIPGKPDFKKEKGTGKVRNYTLFTSRDFIELMSKDFFTDWEWGDYSEFFL